MTKQMGQIDGILCRMRSVIDYTKFMPPLNIGGVGRVKIVESGIDATRKVLDQLRKVANEHGYKEIIKVLDAPVEYEEHLTAAKFKNRFEKQSF